MPKNRQTTLRIIGGKWRGRKLKVCQSQYIRPTSNIVRETLFNWLAPVIQDAICLDLFAGSGALGFEALSRGAKQVVMLDKSKQVINTLKANAAALGIENIEFLCREFTPKMPNPFAYKFDILFLDPPFYQDLIAPCAHWLEQNSCLADAAYIYIEAESSLKQLAVPVNWEIHRQKITGQVNYSLWRRCTTCTEA